MQQQQRGATLEQRRADVDDTAWEIREERALCELLWIIARRDSTAERESVDETAFSLFIVAWPLQ